MLHRTNEIVRERRLSAGDQTNPACRTARAIAPCTQFVHGGVNHIV